MKQSGIDLCNPTISAGVNNHAQNVLNEFNVTMYLTGVIETIGNKYILNYRYSQMVQYQKVSGEIQVYNLPLKSSTNDGVDRGVMEFSLSKLKISVVSNDTDTNKSITDQIIITDFRFYPDLQINPGDPYERSEIEEIPSGNLFT